MVFGGLIRSVADLHQVDSSRFILKGLNDDFVKPLDIGDSVAVNGVCLTVVEKGPANELFFDVSEETRQKTTLGLAAPPTAVHAEKALAYGDQIGGHIVSGHVHNVGFLTKLDQSDGTMIVKLPRDRFPKRPILKDSITIDGVSLTIAEVMEREESVRIALIPHTVKITLFRTLEVPAPVNVEIHIASGTTWNPDLEDVAKDARTDFEWMLEAVKEGELGRFTAPPNPWVGAILVDENHKLLAAGHHVRPGEPHAERNIKYDGSWGKCTLYVTLEPCSHHGRTPPCVDYVLEKRPARVVVGTLDPDTRVSGTGVAALRAAGIEVTVGVARDAVEFSLRAYLWHRSHNSRPYVIAKLALSQDNCFAYVTDTPDQRDWITGERARCHGHGVRAGSQKVVVGKNTANMDKPKLNVRYDYVIDKQPEAVVSTRALTWLREGDNQCVQVLVEGGPELQNDLLRKRLINEFILYRSTKHLGLKGIRWMPSFLDRDWKLVETTTFEDGDTMQRFIHQSPAYSMEADHQQSQQQAAHESSAVEEAEADADPERRIEYTPMDVAIKHLQDGGLIVVMDDAGRENEGDLMMLADRITLRNMKVLLSNTTGIVCACMTEARAKQLSLPLMVANDSNADKHRTKFTVSVDASSGITTGVSAADRTRTLELLADASAKAADFARPGHIFPLIAAPGGLIERRGHTEAGVELARLCGMENPVMVISELYDHSTGRMMSAQQCSQLGLPIIHVEGIKRASLNAAGSALWCDLPLQQYGSRWRLAMVNGTKILHHRGNEQTDQAKGAKNLMLRIHSECFTGDVLGSALCDCGNQLNAALKSMSSSDEDGVLVFPPEHEGRGIGLAEKIKAYALQRGAAKLNTFEANRSLGHPEDARTYATAIFALRHVGFPPEDWRINLLTENPSKKQALEDAGYAVSVLHFRTTETPENQGYLETKRSAFAKDGGVATTPTNGAPAVESAQPASADLPLRKMAPKPWVLSEGERAQLAKASVRIVQAEWHRHMSDMMVDFMTQELRENYGVTDVEREFAPGSFELPRIIQHAARRDGAKHTVYVAVGVLVKGDTDHYDIVATETSRNLASMQLTDDLWIVNAVLACHTMKQVEERCDPKSDKCVAPHMAHAAARLALQTFR